MVDKKKSTGRRKSANRTRSQTPKQSQAQSDSFREALVRTVIARPLIAWFEDKSIRSPYDIIIDINLDYAAGREAAREQIVRNLRKIVEGEKSRAKDAWPKGLHRTKSELTPQYLFGSLSEARIRQLVKRDLASGERAIHRIWPDFPLEAQITRSVATTKCDAARISFSALGEGIVWAVMDSGIDENHIHFQEHRNLELEGKGHKLPVEHQDFTSSEDSPLTDELGHGTHVAGIIAGEVAHAERRNTALKMAYRERNPSGDVTIRARKLDSIAGMAPKTKLVSLKVLDKKGSGHVSNLIAAIAYVQKVNGNGRRIKIHGVNMSVGYPFDAQWFACGQSPLCVEVDRLVRSGVTVVVAAGNTGYGTISVGSSASSRGGIDLTINDPGNAELAITVGATHRDSPHTYGISFFSSKGPTGDGRLKPDIVAPGERIISCAAGANQAKDDAELGEVCQYREDSGTSMAAPHVSGAVAAFLSVRKEFIERPDEVKRIFLESATDLGRERYFQGHGLLDVMRALQLV